MKATMGTNEVQVYLDETVDGAGHFIYTPRRPEGRIHLHPDQKGLYLLDSVLHEAIHASEHFRHLKLKHSAVYSLAADLAEFLVTSKLVDATEFEARLRMYAKVAEEESK